MTFPDPKIWKCHFFFVSLHRILHPAESNFRLGCIAEVLRLQGVLDHA